MSLIFVSPSNLQKDMCKVSMWVYTVCVSCGFAIEYEGLLYHLGPGFLLRS